MIKHQPRSLPLVPVLVCHHLESYWDGGSGERTSICMKYFMHMQVTVTFNWLQHTTYTSRSCIFSQKPLQVLRILLEGWQRRRTSVALWFLQTGIVLQDLQHYMWKLRTNKHLYEIFYAYAGDSDIQLATTYNIHL